MASKRMHEALPVASLLLAATLWGLLWYPLRLLEAGGLSGLWSSLVIYLAALVAGLPWLLRRRREFFGNIGYLALLGIAAGGCNVAFILAVLDGTVVRVLLLFYLSPLWAVLLGRIILGEHMSRYAQGVLVLAMVGALMMLWEPELGVPWPRGLSDWLAILSGFSFALSNVLIRKREDISVASKVVATWFFGALLAGGGLWATTAPWPQVSGAVLAGAAVLGIAGTGLATALVQYGVSHMPVHRSAVIMLSELVVGAASSLLLTDEIVRPIEWAGGALILAAAWLTARRQVESS